MSSNQLRDTLLRSARSIVIKIGTAVLTRPDGAVDRALIRRLVDQLVVLAEKGRTVTIVSSGAIGAGMGVMNMKTRPTTTARKQAIAAVGQRALMRFYEDAFKKHGLHTAQILVTRADFENRTRYLNIRNTIATLHKLGAVPIINENDTVAVDEIQFGDNDILSALTTNLIRADVLVLLTVVDGLLDRRNRTIDLVEEVGEKIMALAGHRRSALGSGGMKSKLEAVRCVVEAGELALIANGRTPRIIERIFDGRKIGTVFTPAATKLSSRRRWIGWTVRPAGAIRVDRGAARALLKGGKSLLAIGITEVHGPFQSGDVVEIRDENKNPVARGLVSFSSEEVEQIKGVRTERFKTVLGYVPVIEEVVHRNQLVLVRNRPR